MSTILDSRRIEIAESESPLALATEGGGSWEEWDRYLLLDGKKAHHIGNICGTCAFFFERLPGACRSVNVEEVVAELSSGLTSVSAAAADQIRSIIPTGQYQLSLHQVAPTLTVPGDEEDYFIREQVALWGIDGFVGLPHHPRTEYYRADTLALSETSCLYEFLVPMFPHGWLSAETIAQFTDSLEADERPTAIAISVLDVKSPADWAGEPAVTEHWCLAHYLIDGHHKTFAASKGSREITLLSFLAIGKGVSSEEQIDTVLALLRERTRGR